MAVKIRLTRIGGKNDPHYRIVVKTAKSNRDGKSLEILGYYNPMNKETKFDLERINHWISVGAQPTKTVERLMGIKHKETKTAHKEPVTAGKKTKAKKEAA